MYKLAFNDSMNTIVQDEEEQEEPLIKEPSLNHGDAAQTLGMPVNDNHDIEAMQSQSESKTKKSNFRKAKDIISLQNICSKKIPKDHPSKVKKSGQTDENPNASTST